MRFAVFVSGRKKFPASGFSVDGTCPANIPLSPVFVSGLEENKKKGDTPLFLTPPRPFPVPVPMPREDNPPLSGLAERRTPPF